MNCVKIGHEVETMETYQYILIALGAILIIVLSILLRMRKNTEKKEYELPIIFELLEKTNINKVEYIRNKIVIDFKDVTLFDTEQLHTKGAKGISVVGDKVKFYFDGNNDYIIVYSQPENRPSNARSECGVTWQDFGPDASQGFILRWMNVYLDHYMEEYAPTDDNIPWKTGGWSEENYDKSLVGKNEPGVMGPYLQISHHLDKDEFEQLGCPVDASKIPEWKE